VELYRKNPQALASLRAPLFEEKVVDFLVELATVTERTVPREELLKEDDARTLHLMARSHVERALGNRVATPI